MKTKNEIISVILIIILLFSFGVSCFGSYLFATGYHNLDLSQNILHINSIYNTKYVDYYDINKTISYYDLYVLGHKQMVKGFYLSTSGCLIFGYILVVTLTNFYNLGINGRKKEKEKEKDKNIKFYK